MWICVDVIGLGSDNESKYMGRKLRKKKLLRVTMVEWEMIIKSDVYKFLSLKIKLYTFNTCTDSF